MTNEEINQIKNSLDRYNPEKIVEVIVSAYPELDERESYLIGQFKASDIPKFVTEVIERTQLAIETDYLKSLPSSSYSTDTYNVIIPQLIESINSGNISNVSNYLTYALTYQATFGMLVLAPISNTRIRSENLSKLESKYQLLSQSLINQERELSNNIKSFLSEKKKIDTYTVNKQVELEEISSLVSTARVQTSEITNLLSAGNTANNQLEVLLTQQKERIGSIVEEIAKRQTQYENLEGEFINLKDSLSDEIQKVEDSNENFAKLLKSVTDKSSHFDARLTVLNELLGKEAANQLFNTFNDRKKELIKPVQNWATAVYSVAIISFIIILALFTNGFGIWAPAIPATVSWQYFLITLTKTVPILLIFYFTIRQYNRERTFMEEYAFRSAIALTIQAYADLAGERKEELIVNAVTNIYTQPKTMRESSSLFGFRSRHIPQTLKEMNDSLKTLVGQKKGDT